MQQSMTFKKVNRMIIQESENYKRFGAVKVYRIALELLKDDSLADQFMLSIHGGYSIAQLHQVKYNINRTSTKQGSAF
jgi:hypothetical protein